MIRVADVRYSHTIVIVITGSQVAKVVTVIAVVTSFTIVTFVYGFTVVIVTGLQL